MFVSKVMVRALLGGLAFGLVQGCTAVPEKAVEEDSLAETVVDSLYRKRVYITGSRIAKVVDTRKSVEAQSSQPLRIVKMK